MIVRIAPQDALRIAKGAGEPFAEAESGSEQTDLYIGFRDTESLGRLMN